MRYRPTLLPSSGPGRRARSPVIAVAAVAALAAVGLPAVGVATVTAATRGAPAAGTRVTPSRGAAPATVPLVTGDQVVMTVAGGGGPVMLRSASGGSGSAETFQTAGGDRYVIPVAALPYAGRQLDMSLFDVSALARDGIAWSGARIPVTLSFTPGARAATPPGVILTSVRGNTARGYLTAASARLFSAALRRQDDAHPVGRNLAAVRPGVAAAPLAGLTRMSLDASGPAGSQPVAQPHYPLHILQLNVTDETGLPANNAAVEVVNTDDVRREVASVPIVDGVGRIAVPAGDYSLIGLFIDLAAFRLVIRDDFGVPATSAVTTVAVAERSATSATSATVPRPATPEQTQTVFYRAGAVGPAFTTGLILTNPDLAAIYISPQPAPKVGRLRYMYRWSGTGPGSAYYYDAAFASQDIPADERFVVRRGQVATVHEHFSADPASPNGPGLWSNDPCDPTLACDGRSPGPLLGGIFPYVVTASMPGDLTLYVGTTTGDRWLQTVQTPNSGYLVADPLAVTAGHSYGLNWAHGPLAPALGTHTGPWQCQACTAGRTLSLSFSPLGDSEPDHFTLPLQDIAIQPQAAFTLYRDGTKLLSASAATGAVVHNIPAGPAVYRAVLDTSLTGTPGWSQSTQTHTDITVRYVPGGEVALPAQDTCDGQSAGTPCRILPVLSINYQLAGNETNVTNSPAQTLRLHVGHLSYDGAGSRAPVTSATVSVSFDGGATWQRAKVTGSHGAYSASWANPASARGTSPELRVTANDAVGGSITQTITNAYTIAKATAAHGPVSRPGNVRDVCPKAAPGHARCLAVVRTDIHGGTGTRGPAAIAAGHSAAAALPAGYGPADLASAYKLPSVGGTGQTVAIVDAGDDPNAEADLAVYRATYGLPPCTTANGCFRKVNQLGAANPLPPNWGWGPEISLDLDMVSAACPSCKILLVEAGSPTDADLAGAENTAVALGATEISNSYGATEYNGMQALAAAYAHPGTAIVASSGDSGYGLPSFPAVLHSVIAVGGTSLNRAANARGWAETAWSGAGSGCSAWIAKPAWQHDPNCPGRMTADVAADADPQTGPAVYDSFDQFIQGWAVVGGTSASSPLIAGVIALGGHPGLFPGPSRFYTHAKALNDITHGSNAGLADCGGDYQCNAARGYDGPTGNGTPNGLAAF